MQHYTYIHHEQGREQPPAAADSTALIIQTLLGSQVSLAAGAPLCSAEVFDICLDVLPKVGKLAQRQLKLGLAVALEVGARAVAILERHGAALLERYPKTVVRDAACRFGFGLSSLRSKEEHGRHCKK